VIKKESFYSLLSLVTSSVRKQPQALTPTPSIPAAESRQRWHLFTNQDLWSQWKILRRREEKNQSLGSGRRKQNNQLRPRKCDAVLRMIQSYQPALSFLSPELLCTVDHKKSHSSRKEYQKKKFAAVFPQKISIRICIHSFKVIFPQDYVYCSPL